MEKSECVAHVAVTGTTDAVREESSSSESFWCTAKRAKLQLRMVKVLARIRAIKNVSI